MSVLIVEDDEAIRETLRLALESQGYEVRTAANGQEGLAELAAPPAPSLILLDLMMPVMNGWEFARRLRQKDGLAAIPIVVISAYSDKLGDGDLKACEVIQKPFELRSLLQTVHRYYAN